MRQDFVILSKFFTINGLQFYVEEKLDSTGNFPTTAFKVELKKNTRQMWRELQVESHVPN